MFAPALRSDVVRRADGTWVVATTLGVRFSADGCSWAAADGVTGYVAGLDTDGDRVWALTYDGLYASDDGRAFALLDPVEADASLRAMVRTPDGWVIFGYSADGPAAWTGAPGSWTRLPLPVTPAFLWEPLGVDDAGRAWLVLPRDGLGTVLRVDGTAIDVVATDLADVSGAVFEPDAVILGTTDRGLLRSDDDGATWAVVDPTPLRCLGDGATGWLGCPDSAAGLGAVAAWDDGWTSEVGFHEVAGPLACPAGSDVAAVCDWDTVRDAFAGGASTGGPGDSGLTEGGTAGIAAPDTPDAGAGARCGCRSSPGAGPWWLLALLGWRRRGARPAR